jgi:hypothetical protein
MRHLFAHSVIHFRPGPGAGALLLLMAYSRLAAGAGVGPAASLTSHMSGASLIGGIIFGSLGVGYFIYGKKQGKVAYLVCGAALAIYTFVVSSAALVIVIGLLLSAGPWLLERFF